MSRRQELLEAAAIAFENAQELGGHFLREHEVTADECFELLEDLAFAARVVHAMDTDERAAWIVQLELGPYAAAAFSSSLSAARTRRRLRDLQA